MNDILSLDSRKRIYEFVETNSGSHLREIGRKCDLPLGTALYHLDRLESEGLLTVRRDGRYKRYFPSTGLGRRDKDFLSAFRHAVPRRIAVALLRWPLLTQRELCQMIGVSRSTLSFHVNSMIERGIVRREPSRPENRYRLEDPELTHGLLLRYQDSLGDVSPLQPLAPAMGIVEPRTVNVNAPPLPTPAAGGSA